MAPTWGLVNYKDEDLLYAAMAPYFAAGSQLSVHSNGDRATEQVLGVYEQLHRDYPLQGLAQTHSIEHFTVMEPQQVRRASDLGLASATPSATYTSEARPS